MKILKFRYIVLFILIMGGTSCDLAKDLDEYDPLYALVADDAIENEEIADLALMGIYNAFNQNDGKGTPYIFFVPELMGPNYVPNARNMSTDQEYAGWVNNNPTPEGGYFGGGIYLGMYALVNKTNWFIEKVDLLDEAIFSTPEKKNEMLAEARTMRALGHFYLLRLYGEFYDVSSEYGLDVRLSPAKSADAFARKSVQETYDAILADLDFAITNNPTLREHYFVSKAFAKGLKARTLLYMGDYANAAIIAKDVIDNSGPDFGLASSYTDLFLPHSSQSIFDNEEVLFGTNGKPENGEGVGMGNFIGYYGTIAPRYAALMADAVNIDGQDILYDGDRADLLEVSPYGTIDTRKYTFDFTDDYEMIYHMRMAEVHLILAEASARAASSVTTEALDALNQLRSARGATNTGADGFEVYPNTVTYDQFLELVRIEKEVELTAETGEPWFDLIRYDYADGFGSGFQVSDLKATAMNSNKFILPIPQASIDAAGGVVKQNPSYE